MMSPKTDNSETADTSDRPRDFLRVAIAADLAAGTNSEVITRFPPEPNGQGDLRQLRHR